MRAFVHQVKPQFPVIDTQHPQCPCQCLILKVGKLCGGDHKLRDRDIPQVRPNSRAKIETNVRGGMRESWLLPRPPASTNLSEWKALGGCLRNIHQLLVEEENPSHNNTAIVGIALQPTNGTTQRWPNPPKIRLEVLFRPVFARFMWFGLVLGNDVRRFHYYYYDVVRCVFLLDQNLVDMPQTPPYYPWFLVR